MHLLPAVKEISIFENNYIITYACKISVDSKCEQEVLSYAKLLQEDFKRNLGYELAITKGDRKNPSIYLTESQSLGQEEYNIQVSEEGIIVEGGSKIGLLHGIQTLRQIVLNHGATIPYLRIKDYPSIEYRGFYHDVTRGRVPTLDYLKKLADKLSYYKLNQLQLYVEHSFLFEDFSEIWRDDSPLTAEDILELDAYCHNLNIELVPSLSTFGHLFKTLNSKTYNHLCEIEGYELQNGPFLDRMQHHTIDVSNPESLQFIKKLIEEFLPLFRSNHFNICGDETYDLGKGKSKTLADQVGIKNMYTSYVKELCEFLISNGKRPMFWGDIIGGFPDAINQLPEEVICLNWGYAAEQREDETINLHNVGATQYLCPGVGGWNQFINLIEASFKNISRMCQYAHKYNALGVLNTDWGDFGHINHPEFSFIGLIYGASFSWSEEIIDFEEINKKISFIEYRDKREEIVSIISDISKASVYGWNPAIWFKEVHSVKNYEEQKICFFDTDLSNINEANDSLERNRIKLYGAITGLDTSQRSCIKAYIVATEGIQLFNTIGATISEYRFETDNPASMNPLELAVKLEEWFYHFKLVWRTTSKESDLGLIQESVVWFADYLRDCVEMK